MIVTGIGPTGSVPAGLGVRAPEHGRRVTFVLSDPFLGSHDIGCWLQVWSARQPALLALGCSNCMYRDSTRVMLSSISLEVSWQTGGTRFALSHITIFATPSSHQSHRLFSGEAPQDMFEFPKVRHLSADHERCLQAASMSPSFCNQPWYSVQETTTTTTVATTQRYKPTPWMQLISRAEVSTHV